MLRVGATEPGAVNIGCQFERLLDRCRRFVAQMFRNRRVFDSRDNNLARMFESTQGMRRQNPVNWVEAIVVPVFVDIALGRDVCVLLSSADLVRTKGVGS